MIAQELEENIQFAFRDARDRNLEYVTVEHLVLVLLDSREVIPMLKALGANRRSLREDLERYLQQVPRHSRGEVEPRPTPGFQRVIRRAIEQAKEGGSKAVTGINVLYSVHHEPESYSSRILDRRSVTRAGVSSWMRRRLESSMERPSKIQEVADEEEELTTNLSLAAAEGKIERPFCRRDIVDAVLRVLLRKYKCNPVLVGEPGVGKTAIVHTIAHEALGNDVPKALSGLAIHEVNVASLVAGTKYRGDFEARLKKLIATLAQKPGALLFIDEIHTLVGAGSVSGGTLDAANILKPALVNGTLRCIGATTQAEFTRVFAKDAALTRRFQKIDVAEPSTDEAVTILREFKPRLENHHGIPIGDGSIEASVRLSDRYISSRCLPDKAIDLLDEAGASAALDGEPGTITPALLRRTVAKISGMPPDAVGRDERKDLRNLERLLSRSVFGQQEAVDILAPAVRRARFGISEPGKPIGSFLFAGPTGVGKTEMAKALAEALGVKLLRFDMSEHMERHTVSRLIGAPPGYVGFEQQGMLTDRISQHPHCVLLLDEIEKAHPDIFNILLQVMDYGSLTDNFGVKADFRHAVIIMTTNAGAQEWAKNPLGFSENEVKTDESAAIDRLFAPEFRNRLNAVVHFSPLPRQVARKIVTSEIAKVATRLLTDRGIKLTVSSRMLKWLLDNGLSESFGARPLKRLLETKILDAIADEESRSEIKHGSIISIDLAGEDEVKVERLEEAAADVA